MKCKKSIFKVWTTNTPGHKKADDLCTRLGGVSKYEGEESHPLFQSFKLYF